jgi:hypothetical protein
VTLGAGSLPLLWRQTDAPLRAMGLGACLLGPACGPLALLWRLYNERPVSATQPVSPLFLRPLERPGVGAPAEVSLAAPLPLSKGLGATTGVALWAAPAGLGPPAYASEIRIPRRGSRPLVWRTATPLSSRVGSVAKIAVLSPGSSQSTRMP